MVVAQKTKEAEITEQDSLLLTRNLLRIAIFNISYIRGLFPEKYFNDKSVPALEMKIKKLMPVDAEPRRLIDWMEKGVYDALQKKYLKTLLFCVCESSDGAMIEEYACPDNQEVSMNINRTGNKKQGGTFNCNSTTQITPNQMRSSACKMIRTLVQLMKTLDKMPDERTIIMKLLYHDDVTPLDYEPPFFRGCTEEEAHNPWTKNPLKMEIGNVNSKHLILTLKVKSVLDPCEDENDDIQDDEVSLGADSVRMDDSSSDSDSEISQTQEGEYVIAPVGIITEKQRPDEDIGMADADNTQDPEEDEQQFTRVKDWINSHQLDTVELDDVFFNFPDISAVLTDGNKELYHRFQAQLKKIMDKLVKEGVLSKTGRGSYTIIRQKKFDYEFDVVKEELDGQAVPAGYKVPQVDDPLYMKALYHALQMKYVTVAGLQNKLDGEANQTAVRKLTNRMSQDGFLEAKGNRRLGKRVIHSRLSEKKLMEAKKAIGMDDAMDVEANEPNKSNHLEESNHRDASTCGGVHSIGSDLTRMKIRSGLQQNGSIRSEQTVSRTREHGNTPTSMAEPVASRESFVPENENSRTNGNGDDCEHADTVICSRSTPEKRCRKTSTVKEPILQSLKRQRSQDA